MTNGDNTVFKATRLIVYGAAALVIFGYTATAFFNDPATKFASFAPGIFFSVYFVGFAMFLRRAKRQRN